METDGIEKLLREGIEASKAMTIACERKALECANQAQEYANQVIALERDRISRDAQIAKIEQDRLSREQDRLSRDAQTAAIEASNRLIQERNQKLESVLEIFHRMFIDERTIEDLIKQQADKINDVNTTLIRIATILQLQATRVIEALVVDDKTKEEYYRLLATIESGLRRGDQKIEFKSERDMNLKSRDIGN